MPHDRFTLCRHGAPSHGAAPTQLVPPPTRDERKLAPPLKTDGPSSTGLTNLPDAVPSPHIPRPAQGAGPSSDDHRHLNGYGGIADAPPPSVPVAPMTPSSPLASAYIDEVIRDITREFHDHEHTRSNRTQALNLWGASGLDEDTFVEVLYVARGITRSRGNIEKRATMSPGSGLAGARNRMPYFFSVLRNELRSLARRPSAREGAL